MERGRTLGHRPGLDGLRGVAVSLVVGYHAWSDRLPGGWVGVDVFFVLSGFLITALLLEERRSTGRIWLVGFYERRILRLVPAVVAFLVVVAIYQAASGEEFIPQLTAWAPRFYLTNLSVAFGVGDGGLAYLWSLAAEEQFYALWPPLFGYLLHRGLNRFVISALTTAAVVASAAHALVLWVDGAHWTRLYFAPDTHATPILVGCLLGQLWFWRLLPSWVSRAWMPGIAVISAVALLVPPDADLPYAGGFLAIAVAAAALVAAVLDGRSIHRFLAIGALGRIGRHSYAIYLWHPFLLHLAAGRSAWNTAAGVVLTYPVAAASMVLVEQPFLKLKARLLPTTSRPRRVPAPTSG